MTPRRQRGDLSRAEVIAVALRLVDTGGMAACTVRAIAGELGVTPMAIYWHVKDKDALLDAVLDRVFAEIDLTGLPQDPIDALAAVAHGYRDAFARHPHAAPLLASRPSPRGPAALAVGERTLALLAADGLRDDDLRCAYLLLAQFVMASVITEQRSADQPGEDDGSHAAAPDPRTCFEFGLDCLLVGIRERARSGVSLRRAVATSPPAARSTPR